MAVYIQPRIIPITLLLFTVSLVCEGRSNSRLAEAVNKLSQLYQAGNESEQINPEYTHIVDGIHEGIENAVKECKTQFKWDRWNCPIEASTLLTNPYVSKATREAAFIQAISAASIMYHVTKKCNNHNKSVCRCKSKVIRYDVDKIPESGSDIWKWRGCMHNVKFGEKVSKMFLDTNNESSRLKTHNERAGLVTVRSSFTRQCKCHGPTGGCVFKTCWLVLPEFSSIAAQLKEKYREALSANDYTLRTSQKVPKRNFEYISKHDLAYSEYSSNYCEPDNVTGYQGVSGRKCKRAKEEETNFEMSEHEHHDCVILCCGNVSQHPVMEQETHDCDCTFQWCCTVNCRQCQKKVWRYFCK